ncbi:hypothetical protein [Vaginisenegalia massiliensis]|uniref:hypothetical protein n=1 Tax=Vaginisenegalia massiliensis TaxID=2058294 RepID=UPI000F534328|nr:hypothetical protein [Vaginisenegalia massiliensis]
MKSITSKFNRLNDFLAILDGTGYPVFAYDTNVDEMNDNDSFWVYMDKGNITKGEANTNWHQEFTFMFISKSAKEIDEISIIQQVEGLNILFDRLERETFKLAETQQMALTVTFNCHTIIRVCG